MLPAYKRPSRIFVPSPPDWAPYIQRFRNGEWRGFIFRDMILDEAEQRGEGLTFLDIGCGHGFDGYLPPQETLASVAGCYIGIEPDLQITPASFFTTVHRCLFENAPVAPNSVHVAFAVMVLEHLPMPQRFWNRLRDVLVDGGVFWALTVDARHWFSHASLWTERLHIKELYLNKLMGQRGTDRYENYPVYYRCNTPEQIRHYAQGFRSIECVNLSRVGQCNECFPRILQPLASFLDRHAIRKGKPGPLLVARAVK